MALTQMLWMPGRLVTSLTAATPHPPAAIRILALALQQTARPLVVRDRFAGTQPRAELTARGRPYLTPQLLHHTVLRCPRTASPVRPATACSGCAPRVARADAAPATSLSGAMETRGVNGQLLQKRERGGSPIPAVLPRFPGCHHLFRWYAAPCRPSSSPGGRSGQRAPLRRVALPKSASRGFLQRSP